MCQFYFNKAGVGEKKYLFLFSVNQENYPKHERENTNVDPVACMYQGKSKV